MLSRDEQFRSEGQVVAHEYARTGYKTERKSAIMRIPDSDAEMDSTVERRRQVELEPPVASGPGTFPDGFRLDCHASLPDRGQDAFTSSQSLAYTARRGTSRSKMAGSSFLTSANRPARG